MWRKNKKIKKQKSYNKKEQSFWDKEQFPLWKEDKNLTIVALVSTLFFLISWCLIINFFSQLPPEIPLYFIKIGSQALSEKQNLYFLPLGFAFFTLLNFYLGHIFYRREKLLTLLLLHVSLLLNFMLIIIILKLLYITGLIF